MEHDQAPVISATFADSTAGVLRGTKCNLPLTVTRKDNAGGSVTLLVTDTTTPTATFAPYFDWLTT